MKEILRNMGLKISMISKQLGITRPTLYKFIEMYDSGNAKDIKNSKVKKLFKFIEKNKYSSPNLVIDYMINGLNDQTETNSEKRELLSLVRDMTSAEVKKLLMELKEGKYND